MSEQSHLEFRKSSYSSGKGQNCVEVAEGSAVRDSQHPGLGHLAFTAEEWKAFLSEVKADRL